VTEGPKEVGFMIGTGRRAGWAIQVSNRLSAFPGFMKQISTMRQSIPWNPIVSTVSTRFPHYLHTASTH